MALAGHPVLVYIKNVVTAPIAGDEVNGLNSVGYSPKVDLLDVTDFQDTSAAHLKLAALTDGGITLAGDLEMADAPQTLLRTSWASGASVWVSCYFNPSGSAGTKGFKVECKVESFTINAQVAGKVEFSCSLAFTGAPVVDP